MGSFRQILRGVGYAFGDGRVRSILAFTLALVLWASVFYRFVEGWSWLDSIYFSVIAVSTVGFGDISPDTAGGKIFTMFYIVIGLGVFVTAATTVADAILSQYKADKEQE
ncbi:MULTISPECIES: potassium channel family protein [Aliiruegeria]|uniref:Ion channel n=1 Tax=Aliiruegeria lutimaris TaxID=571298 RepID=A0A1G9J594_9RHOB|nr:MULTISPECIES: potassium channel family protein [Aliiruegeria]NDR55886.1 two pore domain potassium channel family protein [Pseudoruegeria sp. M32A2M]SDL32521.1 Ion channel [Aliiruegeria lutimaris]